MSTNPANSPQDGFSRFPLPQSRQWKPGLKFVTTVVPPRELSSIADATIAGQLPLRTIAQRTTTDLNGRCIQVAYFLLDSLLIVLNGVLVFCLRFVPPAVAGIVPYRAAQFPARPLLQEYVAFLLLLVAFTTLCCQSQGLYRTSRTRPNWREMFSVIKAVAMATVLLTGALYASKTDGISRLVVVVTAALNAVTLVGWRLWKRQLINRAIENGRALRNVLIVGAGAEGQRLARLLEHNRRWGYVVKGFLDDIQPGVDRVLGSFKDLPDVVRSHYIDDLFLTPAVPRDLVEDIALAARRYRLSVELVPQLYDGLALGATLHKIGDVPVLGLYKEPIRSLALFCKRLIDVLVSAGLLLITTPLLALIALVIKIDSPGPLLYRARRVGRKGCIFLCYKFRTMVVNADQMKQQLRAVNERHGPCFKLQNDPRVTRAGKWLRKYSLDELPQLWNVLRGEMSLVGPRPHPVDDFEQYNLEHLRRLDVTPGITGMWQVKARRDPSFETNMVLDLEYIENWGVWTDLKILLQTIPVVFKGSGC